MTELDILGWSRLSKFKLDLYVPKIIVLLYPSFSTVIQQSGSTNASNKLLKLIDKHFWPHSKLYSLFNRKKRKISYFCTTTSIGSNSSIHSKGVLQINLEDQKLSPPPKSCNHKWRKRGGWWEKNQLLRREKNQLQVAEAGGPGPRLFFRGALGGPNYAFISTVIPLHKCI